MDMIIRLLVLLGIFAAAFLASQVLLGAAWQHRQKYAAVNERLRLIRQGEEREVITSRLRKNVPVGATDLPALLETAFDATCSPFVTITDERRVEFEKWLWITQARNGEINGFAGFERTIPHLPLR